MTSSTTPPPTVPKGVVSSGWLAAETTYGQTDQRKVGRALAASLLLHGAGLAIVLFLMTLIPAAVTQSAAPPPEYNLVFVKAEGPGGGGGGGGDRTPLPPRKVEMAATAPKAPAIDPVKVEAPPPPALMAPIQTSSQLLPITGSVTGLSAAPSAGPGSGGGGGDGKGTGAGPGDGPGVGPGRGGGMGDGPMGPGSGAEPPTLLRGVDPRYTPDAMQAKIQGTVELEVLVSPTGAVSDVKVSRSLDRSYGLDAQAVATAKQWIFRPARFKGKAVPYLVLIVMEFNLR